MHNGEYVFDGFGHVKNVTRLGRKGSVAVVACHSRLWSREAMAE